MLTKEDKGKRGEDKMSIMRMIKEADRLLMEYVPIAETIAQEIVIAVWETTGIELDWSLGWAEAGVDTICFNFVDNELSRKRRREFLDRLTGRNGNDYISFKSILDEVFGEAKYLRFDCPFGVLLTVEEATAIRDKLKKEEGKDVN